MEYRSPVCKARICRKSPLMFQHPSFILARRNNRHHFRVSSRVMPMPPGYTKVFGFAPTWCTKVRVARNCSAFFIAIFQRRFNLVQHRVTRTARARRRSGGQKRPSGAFLERGRVPDGAPEKAATNVAAFCCTIPFETDSHFAQALVFVSRGLVAKNGCGFVSRGHD